MPGPQYDASLAEMQAAHTEVDVVARQLADGLTGAARVVEELVGSGWSGLAARAFADGWTRWSTGAEQVVRALGTTAQLIDTAEGTYRERDEATSQALAEIRAVLG